MAWTKKSGVVLNAKMINFLDALSDRLPFDIVVTSGFRSPEQQAAAMFYKIEQGDDLIALYADDAFAQSVIDAYPNKAAGAAAVQAYIDRGGGKNGHITGSGVDIRTRGKTQGEINTILKTVREMGDSADYESIPPHIHVSIRGEYKKKSLLTLAILGALVWMVI